MLYQPGSYSYPEGIRHCWLDSLKIAHIVTHVLAQRADNGRVHHLVFSGGLGLFCLCSFLLLPIGHGFL